MKQLSLFTICIVALPFRISAQAPDGYYDAAVGKTGAALRIVLHDIIAGHHTLSYRELWRAYYTTDKKPGTPYIWDMYSENAGGAAAYYYTLGTDQCSGTAARAEGYCYNREHIWPKSKFSSRPPMYTDLWIVYPTDAFVNGKRRDYPYGEVSSATWTGSNGARLGINTYPGAPSVLCFEPPDSFKGDIARSYFYISTRYYTEDDGWRIWEMANGADLKPWAKQMLLEWHHLDPVSPKETARNHEVYALQQNRNPFIDHPEMADCIFGTADCSALLGISTKDRDHQIFVYPGPAGSSLYIRSDQAQKEIAGGQYTYTILDITGVKMRAGTLSAGEWSSVDIAPLRNGNYILKVISSKATSHLKFTKN